MRSAGANAVEAQDLRKCAGKQRRKRHGGGGQYCYRGSWPVLKPRAFSVLGLLGKLLFCLKNTDIIKLF